jgi:hypothetical protein
MAILPAYPGLSVQVEVHDQPLLEYDDEDAVQDARSVTKYIEACAGSEFSIKFLFDKTMKRKKDICVGCYIDGSSRSVRSRFFRIRQQIAGKAYVIKDLDKKDGTKWQRQNFCFQNLGVGKNIRSLYSIWELWTDTSCRGRIPRNGN